MQEYLRLDCVTNYIERYLTRSRVLGLLGQAEMSTAKFAETVIYEWYKKVN